MLTQIDGLTVQLLELIDQSFYGNSEASTGQNPVNFIPIICDLFSDLGSPFLPRRTFFLESLGVRGPIFGDVERSHGGIEMSE
jgi:hypothetical protein